MSLKSKPVDRMNGSRGLRLLVNHKRRTVGMAGLIGGLVLACTDDFPSEPDAMVAKIRGISGAEVMAITDTRTLQVIVETERGVEFTGIEVNWEVRDSGVLAISESPPPEDSSREDSLAAQLRATVTALHSGHTYVLASVVHHGFEPVTDSILVTVVPLVIERVGEWPEMLFVQNTVLLELAIRNVEGTSLGVRQVVWSSSENLQLTEIDELHVEIETLARGLGEVFATVAEEGFEEVPFADTIQVMERWTSVTAGESHSCAITIKNDVYCWGTGQLGNGSVAGSPIPVPVLGSFKFASVSGGWGHTCGVLVDGRGFCWGRNRFGAVGNGSEADQLAPVPIDLGHTLVSLTSAEDEYACGVTIDGNGFCWGKNDSYQLGDAALDFYGEPVPAFDYCNLPATIECSLVPRPVRTGDLRKVLKFDTLAISAVSPGFSHTCALGPAGDPICWGSGTATVGQDTFAQTREPIPITSSISFDSLSAGATHNCGLTSGGQAYCWGLNSFGQLGTPDVGMRSTTPVEVSGGHQFLSITAGGRNACGIKTDSTALCWGSNEFGQLARPPDSLSRAPVPIQLPGAPKIVSISVGERHGCAVTKEGAAYCWGVSEGGRIGSDSVPPDGSAVPPHRVAEPDTSAT